MKFTKILREGLGDFNFEEAQFELDKTEGDREGALNTFNKSLEIWDPNNITSNFKNTLIGRIGEKGWDENDPFLKWLQNTDDNNIKSLNDESAKHLINILDEKAIKEDNDYILKDNNLFTENSKDIIYKLNTLSILLDPNKADKYKNQNGETPNIDLIYKNGKFENAKEIKKILNDFITDISKDDEDEDTIDFITWAHTKGKVKKGEEFIALINKFKSAKVKYKEPALNAIADLEKLIKSKNKSKLDSLGRVKVKIDYNWDNVAETILKSLMSKDYDVQNGIPVLAALAANISNFSIASLEKNPKEVIEPIITLFKYDNSFDITREVLNKILSDTSKFKILNNTLIPNMKIGTIQEAIKKFILKYSNESNNKEKS